MDVETMLELNDTQFLELLKRRSVDLHERDGRLQVSAPPGALDAELRAELARRKPELLDAVRCATAPRQTAPVRAERNERIPQTQAQQGMWLIDHFSPGNPAYNIPEAFSIDGPVDPSALQRAIDRLLERHEALRTWFYEDDGDLLQAVSPDARAWLGFTDLSAHSGDATERLHAAMQQLGRQSFQLGRAPLVDFHLFRLSKDRHVVFLNIHHIVADARSLTILRHDLAALYRAAMGSPATALPDLPIQFADYAIWAEQRLAEGAWNGQIEYWEKQLSGAPPVFDLPFARQLAARRTPWGATVPVEVPAATRDAMAAMARRENATLFMVLLAAFAVLLYRLSGAEDFSIGSPFTHRNQPGTQNLVGLFVNMLVLRCHLHGNDSFLDVVRRVRTISVEAYENGDVPFQEVVRALKPDPRTMRSPLFQVMFGYEAASAGDIATATEPSTQMDTNPGTARYDLTLQLKDHGETIVGCFEYCTDLFAAPDIQLLAARFTAIAAELSRQPDRPIADLPLLPVISAPGSAAAAVHDASLPGPQGFWDRIARKLSQGLFHRSRG